MLVSPGDFVAEVRLVWTKITTTHKVCIYWNNVLLLKCLQDLYITLIKSVNYRENFGTTDELPTFMDHIKSNGGHTNFKVSAEVNGKRVHSAVALCIKYFSKDVQIRMIKSVSNIFSFLIDWKLSFDVVCWKLACTSTVPLSESQLNFKTLLSWFSLNWKFKLAVNYYMLSIENCITVISTFFIHFNFH